jgi:molybdenum cofactor cytidylyltransferase
MSKLQADPRIFAILPAAGRSRRMGRDKQLLDVGGAPMLLAALRPLAAARVAGVVLVTHRAIADRLQGGHQLDSLPPVFLASNENETSEMIDSVRIGLSAWQHRESIGDRDGFLVCPADQPGIPTSDFNACIAAFAGAPDRIVIASRTSHRGHPIIFPAALVPFVQSTACDTGLNALPRAFPERVLAIECSSPAVARDVDTPEDYGRLA